MDKEAVQESTALILLMILLMLAGSDAKTVHSLKNKMRHHLDEVAAIVLEDA